MSLDLLDYQDLAMGETRQGNCPTCGKPKFYATRKRDGIAYICHRASCYTQGFVSDFGYVGLVPGTPSKPKSKMAEFTGRLYDCDYADQEYFKRRFGVNMETAEELRYWVRQTDDGRYAFPLWGPDDRLRGHCVRVPTWSPVDYYLPPAPIRGGNNMYMPKALTYIDPDVARCGWYHSTNESIVVLVEDCVSAMRVASLGVTAVALLGTNMERKVMAELLQWQNGRRYILALDPDAQDKAYKIAQEWGGALGGLLVAHLICDPKDYNFDEDLDYDLGI